MGDGVGVQFEAFGDEATFAVHADDQELVANFVAQRRVVHGIFNVSNVGQGEFDAGHGL